MITTRNVIHNNNKYDNNKKCNIQQQQQQDIKKVIFCAAEANFRPENLHFLRYTHITPPFFIRRIQCTMRFR